MDAGLNQTRMKIAGELAELGLVLARDLQQAALQAKETDEKVRLAEAFHHVGRGVRQSLAIHAQFERDAEREQPSAQEQAVQAEKSRRDQRRSLIKSTVERLIWTERETLEAPDYVLRSRLSSLVAEEARSEGFLDIDPDLVKASCAVSASSACADPPPQGEVSPKVTEGVAAH